jgi:hypothetical protein
LVTSDRHLLDVGESALLLASNEANLSPEPLMALAISSNYLLQVEGGINAAETAAEDEDPFFVGLHAGSG